MYTLLILLSVFQAFAADNKPILGEPTFSGNGCSPGTSGVALSLDQEVLSVLFDDYSVEAGNGIDVNTKNCNISIPIIIPNDHKLIVFTADYRGYNSLPKGASAVFDTQYQFQGGSLKNPGKKISFKGPIAEEFLDSTREKVKSGCGGNSVFNINTRLTVRTNAQGEQSLSQVDTLDWVSRKRKKDRIFKYRVKLKHCNEPDLI